MAILPIGMNRFGLEQDLVKIRGASLGDVRTYLEGASPRNRLALLETANKVARQDQLVLQNAASGLTILDDDNQLIKGAIATLETRVVEKQHRIDDLSEANDDLSLRMHALRQKIKEGQLASLELAEGNKQIAASIESIQAEVELSSHSHRAIELENMRVCCHTLANEIMQTLHDWEFEVLSKSNAEQRGAIDALTSAQVSLNDEQEALEEEFAKNALFLGSREAIKRDKANYERFKNGEKQCAVGVLSLGVQLATGGVGLPVLFAAGAIGSGLYEISKSTGDKCGASD